MAAGEETRGTAEVRHSWGAYAALLGLYTTLAGGFLALYPRRGRRLPRSYRLRDLALCGVATHKLTRLATCERVTAPLRAPFVEHRPVGPGGPPGAGERARGTGLRRELGELLTCPYCAGPWVAGALLVGLAVAPRATRFVTGIFTAVAVADFLHRGFEATGQQRLALTEGERRRASITELSEGAPT